jgi:WD40 repeat protein
MITNIKSYIMKTSLKRPVLFIVIILLIVIVSPFAYLVLSRPELVDTGIAKLSKTFRDHKASVWAVKFSPDGSLIASGSVDSTVIIRNRSSGEVLHTLKQPEGITNLDFSPNGKFVATVSYDSKTRIWEVATGNLIKTFAGHTGTVWTVAFSPDGKTIASAGEDKSILHWNIETGNILHKFTGHTLNIWSVKFSPDGNTLASGGFDATIKLWDITKGKFAGTITGHSEAVVDLAFSHNGKWLATTSDDKTIKIWNMADTALIKTLSVPEHVQAVAFSPDDKRLMTGGRDQAMIGELIQNFTGNSERFKGVSARLWDIEKGTVLQTFNVHKNDVNDVAYSNDGLWIATASADETVELWQIIK